MPNPTSYRTLMALFSLLMLAACNRSTTGPAATAAAPAVAPDGEVPQMLQIYSAFRPDLSSADNAVKSWWALKDLAGQADVARCQWRKLHPDPAAAKVVSLVTSISGPEIVRVVSHQGDCLPTIYKRDIQEVKQESETRAIVFARLWNASPIPPGAVPDETDTKWRTNGFRVKYLVEKSNGQWKVAQAYTFNEYTEDADKQWRPKFEYSDAPVYPAFAEDP